ncbi:hypothetical protein F400_gp106 [Bacillus phage BCD7]|uniref:Uncharacterized protein n=1 Tax=Bacillus phage BCD7 TaxID=1136534 RepID=J9PU00_9CAUD|nr:hypothetical protein F400_gp106 [Bacillus phage BCD7]AEZ50553.1 hypothetical protein BCD7_0106 [Bacillus phage BCD7]
MEEMTEVAVKQDEFGFKKYGQYLDPMDDYDWLNMATEELADLMKYMKAEQYKRDAIVNKVLPAIREFHHGISDMGCKEVLVHRKQLDDFLTGLTKAMMMLSKNIDGKSGETTPDKQ